MDSDEVRLVQSEARLNVDRPLVIKTAKAIEYLPLTHVQACRQTPPVLCVRDICVPWAFSCQACPSARRRGALRRSVQIVRNRLGLHLHRSRRDQWVPQSAPSLPSIRFWFRTSTTAPVHLQVSDIVQTLPGDWTAVAAEAGWAFGV